MHRSAPSLNLARKFGRQIITKEIPIVNQYHHEPKRCWDVFINHRGLDTKLGIASLLYDHLTRLNIRPFLDKKAMKPGDNIRGRIRSAIDSCKIGVAVFSPNYGESYYCLYELALMMESNKKIIPIFCDVEPSQLRVRVDDKRSSPKDIERFNLALEEAKHTVGLAFDSLKGNWLDVLTNTSEIVKKNLMEIQHHERMQL